MLKYLNFIFTYLAMVTLLIFALRCESARDGFYKVRSDGGYWTRFSLTFEYQGSTITYSTDKFPAGTSRILEVPKMATKTRLLVENEIWINVWRTVIDVETEMPQYICYNVWGSTLHPGWQITPDHQCEANAGGSYKVVNSAGYVSVFKVNALINGSWVSVESKHFSAGMSDTLYVPQRATKTSISIEHFVAIGHPRGFMQASWEAPQNVCYKVTGAIYQPRWEEITCDA